MMRVLNRLGPISISSLLPLKRLNDPDKIDDMLIKDFNKYDQTLTGEERVKRMFKINELDEYSDEFNFVCQSTVMASIIGVVYGGCVSGWNAQKNFVERNQASTFYNVREGQRHLQDKVIMEFMKGGYRIGWRMALFTGCYTLISKVIQVYRGEPSLVEYIVSGTVVGTLYKINMGLKGAFAGGIVGTVLGFVCGGVSLMILKVTDISMGDIHLWQHQYRQKRLAAINKGGKNTEHLENPMQIAHDANLKIEGRVDEIFTEK